MTRFWAVPLLGPYGRRRTALYDDLFRASQTVQPWRALTPNADHHVL